MNSIYRLLSFIVMGCFMASCSSHGVKSSKLIDFKGLHKKAENISARTNDLKKYRMHKVSF
jgi:hypothetical protein